jgi:hypothetical protein
LASDCGSFFGVIEFRYLRGPFFAELHICDHEIRLRPRYLRVFRESTVAKPDVVEVTVGGAKSRGVRVKSATGGLDRFNFVPFSPRDRGRMREELERRGYPLA